MELLVLPGRQSLDDKSTIWQQYSTDGKKWSMPKPRKLGTSGNTEKRLTWFRQGLMRKTRIQRFFGTTDGNLVVSALEVQLEGLNY